MGNLILLLPLLLAGCAYTKTVDRAELEQLKRRRQEPKVSMWYYVGDKNGFHYFHHDDLGHGAKDVRIAASQLSWTHTFALSDERNNWRRLDWGQPN